MTTLTRWEPFRELATMRDTMERLFDEPLFEPMRLWPRPQGELNPALVGFA